MEAALTRPNTTFAMPCAHCERRQALVLAKFRGLQARMPGRLIRPVNHCVSRPFCSSSTLLRQTGTTGKRPLADYFIIRSADRLPSSLVRVSFVFFVIYARPSWQNACARLIERKVGTVSGRTDNQTLVTKGGKENSEWENSISALVSSEQDGNRRYTRRGK